MLQTILFCELKVKESFDEGEYWAGTAAAMSQKII